MDGVARLARALVAAAGNITVPVPDRFPTNLRAINKFLCTVFSRLRLADQAAGIEGNPQAVSHLDGAIGVHDTAVVSAAIGSDSDSESDPDLVAD